MDFDLRIPKPRSFLTLQHDIFISIQGLLSIETGLRIYYTWSFHKQYLWLRLWLKGHHPQRACGSLPSEHPILCPSGQLHHDFDCCLLLLCVVTLCICFHIFLFLQNIKFHEGRNCFSFSCLTPCFYNPV